MTYITLTNATSDAIVTVDCGSTYHAVSGGGLGDTSLSGGGSHIVASYPSNSTGTLVVSSTTNARYWTVTFGAASTAHVGVAVCVPN